MQLTQRTAVFFLFLALAVLGCAPNGERPGLRLGGSATPAPTNFAFVNDIEVIQLEAKGFVLPRVVNIWGVGVDDALYVWSDPGSGWSQRVDKRPDDVRVRIGDKVYEVHATRVSDASETKRVALAYQKKYAKEMVEIYGEVSGVDDFELLYRLTSRN